MHMQINSGWCMRKRQVRTCILLFCVYTDFFTWMYTEFYTFGPWCLHYPQCSCHWRQFTTLHAAPSGATEMFHTTFIHAAASLLSLLPRLSSRLLVSPSERLHQPAERRHPSVPSQHDRTQLQEDLLLQHDEGQPGPHQRWSDRSDGRHLHGKQWVSARGRISTTELCTIKTFWFKMQNTEQCRKIKVFQNVFWPAFLCSPSTVLMCGMAGFSDFYKADWLQQILRRQDEEVGCFGRDSECLNSTIIIINNSLNSRLSIVWLHQPVIL